MNLLVLFNFVDLVNLVILVILVILFFSGDLVDPGGSGLIPFLGFLHFFGWYRNLSQKTTWNQKKFRNQSGTITRFLLLTGTHINTKFRDVKSKQLYKIPYRSGFEINTLVICNDC